MNGDENMCLGVPAKVLSIRRERMLKVATVLMGGVRKEVILGLAEDETVKPGDYVMVHAGVAISKIDEEELEETLKLFKEIGLL